MKKETKEIVIGFIFFFGMMLSFNLLKAQTYVHGSGNTSIKMTSTRDQKYYNQNCCYDYNRKSNEVYVKRKTIKKSKKNGKINKNRKGKK